MKLKINSNPLLNMLFTMVFIIVIIILLILLIVLIKYRFFNPIKESFTSTVKGYYLMSWKVAMPPPTPSAWDFGIWYSGEPPKESIINHINSSAKISAGKKILAIGGAIETGIWSATADINYVTTRLTDIKKAGWDGLCFQVDVCTPNIDFVSAFSNCFASCKKEGLLVIINMNRAMPWSCNTGKGQGTDLINAWSTDKNIDYISPSLYGQDGTTLNLTDLSQFKNIQDKILPTIPYDKDWKSLTACNIGIIPSGYMVWNVTSSRADNSNFCGLDWASANSSCANPCPMGIDTQCPSGQKCYGGVTQCAGK